MRRDYQRLEITLLAIHNDGAYVESDDTLKPVYVSHLWFHLHVTNLYSIILKFHILCL
jgi:hypothetical protein